MPLEGIDWRSWSSAITCFRYVLVIVENPTRHKVNTLELSPRNLVRYEVISEATVLKSLIFLPRISWMIFLRPST